MALYENKCLTMKINLSNDVYVFLRGFFFFLIFAMSHHRTHLWYSSVKKKKKSSERFAEVSDPLYFLKDQTSHYINICISFSKKVFYKKIHFFYCLFVNYPYIYLFSHLADAFVQSDYIYCT